MTVIRGKTLDLLQGIRFDVQIGDRHFGFMECSGLSAETEVAEYREGTDAQNSKRKVPGLNTYGNITLKRGLTRGSDGKWLQDWFQDGQRLGKGARENIRRPVVINVYSRNSEKPVKSLSVVDAFPVKYEWSELKADSSEILMETLEIAHEGLFKTDPGQFSPGPGFGADTTVAGENNQD